MIPSGGIWTLPSVGPTSQQYVQAYRAVASANRSHKERTFDIATGIGEGNWKGYRYTPEEAGEGTMGVPIPAQDGPEPRPSLPLRSWKFWEQQ